MVSGLNTMKPVSSAARAVEFGLYRVAVPAQAIVALNR